MCSLTGNVKNSNSAAFYIARDKSVSSYSVSRMHRVSFNSWLAYLLSDVTRRMYTNLQT